MASENITTPKRSARAGSKITKKDGTTSNGSQRAKPTSEMTLEELSLRAYKMTYERLHGSKKTKK